MDWERRLTRWVHITAAARAGQGPLKVLVPDPNRDVIACTQSRHHYQTLIHHERQMNCQGTQISLLQLFVFPDLPLHFGLEAQTHHKIHSTRLSPRLPGRVATGPALTKEPKLLAIRQSRVQVFSHPKTPVRPLLPQWLNPQALIQVHTCIRPIF